MLQIELSTVNIAGLLLAGLVGLIILLELGLRLLFGFGKPLIYLADPDIGYLLAPNQQTRRFGNRIAINQYSMRSPAIAPSAAPSTLRILLLGDSVANGGWWTDQTKIISEILQQQLQPDLQGTRWQQVEVLNASANSWGPRNELAYLQRFGSFEAQVVVLLLNTDDLFATAPSSLQVGNDINYPDHKPPLALAEVLRRYLFPPAPNPDFKAKFKAVQAESGDRVGFNLTAIQQIHSLIQSQGGQLLLAMTPLLRETTAKDGPRDYEQKARQRLLDFAEREQIIYVDFLPSFNAVAQPETLYRDHIHLSPTGNQLVSETMQRSLQQTILDRSTSQTSSDPES
ncbi:SGNH/GDSL hydrolase family protein [Trichocoleus sp. FACHB-262]|uniref:SGNH/GDSL hydrolase family protein n=1 Tax=Trichocoleus sp. FACHB-262 TaxID=2692869 RepID=UPI0028C400C6|nr:SGNH/GDSL hydrolase family protein [Trichocoleus sp. FACHB-262]